MPALSVCVGYVYIMLIVFYCIVLWLSYVYHVVTLRVFAVLSVLIFYFRCRTAG
jgi:hypothetical protein